MSKTVKENVKKDTEIRNPSECFSSTTEKITDPFSEPLEVTKEDWARFEVEAEMKYGLRWNNKSRKRCNAQQELNSDNKRSKKKSTKNTETASSDSSSTTDPFSEPLEVTEEDWARFEVEEEE